jgi:hypothetical protein
LTASFHSPIARTGLPAEPAEVDSRERDRSDDAWAFAITQALVEARPRLTLPSMPEEEAAPRAAAPPPVSTVNTELTADAGTGVGTGMTGTQRGTSAAASSSGPPLPTKIITELNDSRLGRMEVSVARGASGLHIVINVADAHVKALIEAEQMMLVKSLQGCGLSVDSVKIGSSAQTGTALAPQEVAPERGLARSRGNLNLRPANASRRGYGAPSEEDPEDDAERVNLKA